MPRLPRLWRSRFARSLSKCGSTSLAYSSTVTSLPNALNTEANSSPITPAPTMHSLCGTLSMSSSSRDVSTPSSVLPSIGSIADDEPVAMITSFAVTRSPAASTVSASTKRASPRSRWMLGLEMSDSTPSRNCLTTARLRSITAGKSSVKATSLIPKASASAKSLTIAAVRQRAFVGMHPSLRHVPPTSPRSISATLSPRRAASRAVS